MTIVATEADADTTTQVFLYLSGDKFSDIIRVSGGHSIDCAKPFMHQIAVIKYTLLNVNIMRLQTDVINKPRKIIVRGFI